LPAQPHAGARQVAFAHLPKLGITDPRQISAVSFALTGTVVTGIVCASRVEAPATLSPLPLPKHSPSLTHRLPLPLPLPAAAGVRRLPLGFAVWGASGYCGEHVVGQLAMWREREARKIRAARGLAAGAGGAEESGAAVEAPALAASSSSLPVSEGGGTSPADADSGSTGAGGGGGPGFAAWLPISFSREANEEKRLERLKKRLHTVEEALGLRQPEGQKNRQPEGQGGGGTSPGTR
jgi:hypothetical protein